MSAVDPASIEAANTRGMLHKDKGEYTAARDYLHGGLRAARQVLGDEHPTTLSLMTNLSSLLQLTEKFGEALPLCEEVLKLRRELLGDRHVDTVTSMVNLGSLHESLGELGKAAELRREVVQTRRSTLAEDHPDTLAAMSDLSKALLAQGELAEALELLAEEFTAHVRLHGSGCRGALPPATAAVAARANELMASASSGGGGGGESSALASAKSHFIAAAAKVFLPKAAAAAQGADGGATEGLSSSSGVTATSPSDSLAWLLKNDPETRELAQNPKLGTLLADLQKDPSREQLSAALAADTELAALFARLTERIEAREEAMLPEGTLGGLPGFSNAGRQAPRAFGYTIPSPAAAGVAPEPPPPTAASGVAPKEKEEEAPPPPPASSAGQSGLSSMSDLLVSLGLPQYVPTFEDEEMELEVMRDVMSRQGRQAVDEVLRELGVTSMGHRTRIANALKG